MLPAITPICSRPEGVTNLGNGANDTIREYSHCGSAHDIADTQGDTGTLAHNPLDSDGDRFTLNTVDRLNERTLTPEWRWMQQLSAPRRHGNDTVAMANQTLGTAPRTGQQEWSLPMFNQ